MLLILFNFSLPWYEFNIFCLDKLFKLNFCLLMLNFWLNFLNILFDIFNLFEIFLFSSWVSLLWVLIFCLLDKFILFKEDVCLICFFNFSHIFLLPSILLSSRFSIKIYFKIIHICIIMLMVNIKFIKNKPTNLWLLILFAKILITFLIFKPAYFR